MSAGTVAILLAVLVYFDENFRTQVWQRAASPSAELATGGYQIRHLAFVIFAAVRDQSLEHAPMVVFAVAATILVLFMLRT